MEATVNRITSSIHLNLCTQAEPYLCHYLPAQIYLLIWLLIHTQISLFHVPRALVTLWSEFSASGLVVTLCKRDTEAPEWWLEGKAPWGQWRWTLLREFWGFFKLRIHRKMWTSGHHAQSFLWQTQRRDTSKTEQAPGENWDLGIGNLQRSFVLIIKNMSCEMRPGCSSLLLSVSTLL